MNTEAPTAQPRNLDAQSPISDSHRAVFLHSLFFDGSMFDTLLKYLPGTVAYCPDARGFGTKRRLDQDVSLALQVSDVVDLIRNEIQTPVHLVGSSAGGYIAVRVAHQIPELIRSVTLSCCTPRREPEPARFEKLCRKIEADPISAAGLLEQTMFGQSFLNDSTRDAERVHWRGGFESLTSASAGAARAIFNRPSMEQEVSQLPVPPLLIAGGEDRAKPVEEMKLMASLAKGARLKIIATSGHTPAIEASEQLAAHIADYWQLNKEERNHGN